MESPRKPKLFYGYVIVIACFFIMVTFWGTTFSYGIFFDSLIKEFGWSRAATSGAYSVMAIIFGLTSLIIARLCDRYGPRRVIGICGIIMGIGYLLLSRINAVWQLYLIYDIFIAIGMGSYISLMPMVARWFTRRRALMTAAISSGMGFGSLIIPPVAQKLIHLYEWRNTMIIFGIVILVIAIITTQFLKWDPRRLNIKPYGEEDIPGKNKALSGLSLKGALRTRQFWFVGGMYFTYVFCQTTILVHIYIHALGMHLAPSSAAGIVSIYGVSQIIGMTVSGFMGDRFGNKKGFLAAFSLSTISFIWLLLVAKDAPTFYVFAIIMGLASGAMHILFSPILAEIFGLKSQGVILGSISFLASFGAASGGVIAGYIYDLRQSYGLAFIICGLLAAMAIVYTALVKPIVPKKSQKG